MYRAELHKGESVLTAPQSNALRGIGVLSAKSNGTPNLNLDGLKGETPTQRSKVATTDNIVTPTINNDNGKNIHVSVPIELIIQGNADNSSIQKLMAVLPAEVKRVIEEIFREKLATIGG